MKYEKRQEARFLREQGYSYTEIKLKLNVSKSSISYWVRDIRLTEFQKNNILNRTKDKCSRNIEKLAIDRADRYLKIRESYQNEGRKLVKNCNKKFIAGIMLYWAEGWKNRSCLNLANSDPELVKLFLNFVRENFKPKEEKIKLKIRWFSDNGLSFDEIKKFWLDKLCLTESSLNKCEMDIHGKTNKSKQIGKLPYGIAILVISDTSIIQKIYGAIQEFVGFNNYKWVS